MWRICTLECELHEPADRATSVSPVLPHCLEHAVNYSLTESSKWRHSSSRPHSSLLPPSLLVSTPILYYLPSSEIWKCSAYSRGLLYLHFQSLYAQKVNKYKTREYRRLFRSSLLTSCHQSQTTFKSLPQTSLHLHLLLTSQSLQYEILPPTTLISAILLSKCFL